MKVINVILITILVLILAFLGFKLYKLIDKEVDEFQTSSIQTITAEDMSTITVEKSEELTTYTHRISTFEQTSNDLVKASSLYYDNLDLQYIHVFYLNGDTLTHEEYLDKNIDIGKIKKECLLVVSAMGDIETNLNTKDITVYDLTDTFAIHISPEQTGRYQLALGDYLVKFENLERK